MLTIRRNANQLHILGSVKDAVRLSSARSQSGAQFPRSWAAED
jgi:hypothetical protein